MTTDALPVYNPALLAKALRERGLPGQRSKTAITRLRRERARRRPVEDRYGTDLRTQVRARVLDRYVAEIRRRGGETGIDAENSTTPLAIADRPLWGEGRGMALLHAYGWRWYGQRAKPRLASLSYLCGREDGQVWAVRVPGTIETVAAALPWITPGAVHDARAAGRRVDRQGDVYAIETTRAHDGRGELPEWHTWDPGRRVLCHPQHGEVQLPYPVRFVPQRVYSMGRGAGRGCGD